MIVIVRRVLVLVLALVLTPLTIRAADATPRVVGAAGVDLSCVAALIKSDPATVNVLYPEEEADYYVTPYPALPGTRLTITGEFPRARFMSFHVYDPLLRPIGGVADEDIVPDPGSTNPYVDGADRRAERRDYTLHVEFTPEPADPAPNTIYAGEPGLGRLGGALAYRIYQPDAGTSETGDVDLPRIEVQVPRTTQLLGGLLGTRRAATCPAPLLPSLPGVNELIAQAAGPAVLDDVLPLGHPDPLWHRFTNLPTVYADVLLDHPSGTELRSRIDALLPSADEGGFMSNSYNAYVYATINRRYGDVLSITMKAPTAVSTVEGDPVMRSGDAQVRFWSLCQNEFVTQRFVGCVDDTDVVVDDEGYTTIVISTPEARPAHAVPECGVSWIPWGPAPEGIVIYRQLLANASFDEAIENAARGSEREVMGEFHPRSTYYDGPEAFDADTACRG